MSENGNSQGNLPFNDGWAQALADADIHESGGEHVNEGVDFARYWAMSALLEREIAGDADYVILFEYLQDVAILDSASQPTNALLYQVKKKERGSWSRTDLCRVERATSAPPAPATLSASRKPRRGKKLKGASPLGKLYLSVDRLSDHVAVMGIFLSNAPIALKLQNGDTLPSYSRTCLTCLGTEDFAFFEARLAAEMSVKAPLGRCSAIFVEQTRIPPGAMRECIRGLVSDFFQQRFPTVANVSGQVVERLLDAFSRCQGFHPGLDSLQDIVTKKGFTRAEFTAILSGLSASRPFDARLDNVITSLKAEGFPSRELTKISDAAARLSTALVRHPETKDTANWELALAAAKETNASDYRGAIGYVVEELRKTATGRIAKQVTDTDLHAIAILAIINVEEQSASPSAQH